MSQPTIHTMPSSSSGEQDNASSMTERAEEAKDAGLQIAASAKDEGMAVVEESRRQAADLMREATSQLHEQAGAQKGKAVEGLRALGGQLQSMASGTDAGPAADLAHQASGKVTQFAEWLEQNDPGTVLDEVRNFARRKPGTFLLGALAAGVVAGRVTRGVQGAVSQGSNGSAAAPAAPSVPTTPPAPMTPPTSSAPYPPDASVPAPAMSAEAGLPR